MNTEFDQQLAEILSNELENNENNNTLLDNIIHKSLQEMENKLVSLDIINQNKEYNESLQYDLQKNKSEESDKPTQSNKLKTNEHYIFEQLSPKSLREARLKRFT